MKRFSCLLVFCLMAVVSSTCQQSLSGVVFRVDKGHSIPLAGAELECISGCVDSTGKPAHEQTITGGLPGDHRPHGSFQMDLPDAVKSGYEIQLTIVNRPLVIRNYPDGIVTIKDAFKPVTLEVVPKGSLSLLNDVLIEHLLRELIKIARIHTESEGFEAERSVSEIRRTLVASYSSRLQIPATYMQHRIEEWISSSAGKSDEQRALILAYNGDHAGAAAKFEALVKADSEKKAQHLAELAEEEMQQDKFPDAYRHLVQARIEDPTNVEALLLQGETCLAMFARHGENDESSSAEMAEAGNNSSNLNGKEHSSSNREATPSTNSQNVTCGREAGFTLAQQALDETITSTTMDDTRKARLLFSFYLAVSPFVVDPTGEFEETIANRARQLLDASNTLSSTSLPTTLYYLSFLILSDSGDDTTTYKERLQILQRAVAVATHENGSEFAMKPLLLFEMARLQLRIDSGRPQRFVTILRRSVLSCNNQHLDFCLDVKVAAGAELLDFIAHETDEDNFPAPQRAVTLKAAYGLFDTSLHTLEGESSRESRRKVIIVRELYADCLSDVDEFARSLRTLYPLIARPTVYGLTDLDKAEIANLIFIGGFGLMSNAPNSGALPSVVAARLAEWASNFLHSGSPTEEQVANRKVIIQYLNAQISH
jgi:hypothetical protein